MLLELNIKQKNVTIFITCILGLLISAIFRNNSLLCTGLLGFVVYLLTGSRPTSVYAIVSTISRDINAAIRFFRLNIIMSLYEIRGLTVPRIFARVVKNHPKKAAFTMEDRTLTFQDVENYSNRIASYFKSKGFERGDTIALLMESRPEYPCFWLGLSKIGVISALINSNLRKETLQHSISVAGSKAVIVGTELTSALCDIRNNEGIKGISIFQYADDNQRNNKDFQIVEGFTDLATVLKAHVVNDLSEEIMKGKPRDKMVYIYTSGTTGMPKAAVITHLRYQFMGVGCHVMLNVKNDDIIYNPLPLYHTAGGMLGVGNVLLFGVSMVIRKRFSASNFWTDCKKYNCTVAQYIGELCRYLLTVPQKPEDTKHNIRLMFGNGLRPQIWIKFISRFNIPNIGELYGSTEGNSNLVNFDNQIGAIGFVPKIAEALYPVKLIKCDEKTGEPIRNAAGRCIKCKPGEAGVFIGKINPKRAHSSFSGYADKKASEKKVIKNVFTEGDTYFNSGDILVSDLLGYFYFKDRTGDTFRWRGENVATSEVEGIISNIVGLQDCVVYGVEIPHVEGKAGMAAIVDASKKFDIEIFSAGIRGSLPPYAQPLFVRLLDELPMTGTFKLKKLDLQSEGFDVSKIKDDIYFLHHDGVYRKMTIQMYSDIMNGLARL